PSAVYVAPSMALANPAADSAVVAAGRQPPNFAQPVADVALLRAVAQVLGPQNAPMPPVGVAPEVAESPAHPTVLALATVPWLQGLGCVRSLLLCSGSNRTDHRTMTLGHLGRSCDDSTQTRPSFYAHRD